MNARPVLGALSLLFAALVAVSCGEDARAARPVRVFAAASLTAPFEELARAYEAAHPGQEVELHFAGTPQLVLQLREGARADVFASADRANMQRARETNRLTGPATPFATNRLALVVGRGNPRAVAGLSDLARADLDVALCAPEVPAGRYALEVLGRLGLRVRSLSDEPSVKALLSKVALGELDAGVVYATDLVDAPPEVQGLDLPDEQNVVAVYPIALVADERGPAAPPRGEAFVQFVLSPRGQAVLRSAGFGAP